jgi:hypothetical protein
VHVRVVVVHQVEDVPLHVARAVPFGPQYHKVGEVFGSVPLGMEQRLKRLVERSREGVWTMGRVSPAAAAGPVLGHLFLFG